jgi:hypothetical protein
MDWQTKRKIIYALTATVVVTAVVVFLLRDRLFPQPTCSDFKQNGYETGVDCGGLCDKKCTQEVVPLTVLWSKAIFVASSTYDLVGLVSNSNIDNAGKELGYLFSVFGVGGDIIATVRGSTTAPLDGKFPLIVQNLFLGSTPSKVALTLFDADHYKVKESPTSPTVTINNRRYESTDTSRLYATISNNKRIEIRNLEVRAVLYDSYDNAYAVGKTVVPFIEKEGKQEISFIWSAPLKEEPTRIGIYPIFSPFKAQTE